MCSPLSIEPFGPGPRARSLAKPALVLAWLLCSLDPASAQAAASKPVKIAVQPEAQSVDRGGEIKLQCALLDANNQPARAPKEFKLAVESRWPSGRTVRAETAIKKGANSVNVSVPARESGVVEIRVKHRELLDGITMVKVRSRAPVTVELSTAGPIAASEPGSPVLVSAASHDEPGAEVVLMARNERIVIATNVLSVSREVELSAPDRSTAAVAPEPPPAPAAVADPGPAAPAPLPPEREFVLTVDAPPASMNGEIGLILKPESRKYLADGKDAATIYAFLDAGDREIPSDVQVTLFNSRGQMIPMPLLIPKGGDVAQAKLTSDRVGKVTVEYLRSKPAVKLRSENTMQIEFGPPITGLEVHSSPPTISLLERAELLLKLVDRDGRPVATDEPRQIDLALLEGGGSFDPSVVTVGSNSASVRATFLPHRRGQVRISASTPNLLASDVVIHVTFPVMLSLCSALGGIAGGAVAASVSKRRRGNKGGWVMRIFVGMITGFVVYYFGVLGFISGIPQTLALSPFAAFFLSILGGWLGTEAFTLVLQKLGVGVSPNY